MSLNNQSKHICFGNKVLRAAVLLIILIGVFWLLVCNWEVDLVQKIEPSRIYVQFNQILFGSNSKTTEVETKNIGGKEKNSLPTVGKQHDFIINTQGCKIPNFDPWDPSVIQLIKLHDKPYECQGQPLFFMTEPNGSIVLKQEVMAKHRLTIEDFKCWYQSITRKHETPGSKREIHYKFGPFKAMKFGADLGEDYVKITCDLRGRNRLEHFLPLVRLKDQVEKLRTSIEPSSFDRLNVIMVGIDSVSKLNFLRHFRKTRRFLGEKLPYFEMKGYVKVGENTFPNLIPMLTGHFYSYYWDDTMRDTFFFDGIDLIWKEYAAKGYRTFYAEDNPHAGTFQYGKRGFYDPPTDYYFRPLALALYQSRFKKKKAFCVNSDLEMDIMYKYMLDFVRAMDTRPFFAFTMISTVTHDNINKQGYADDPTMRLLENLLGSGALDNSVLILFSDHGIRFGPIRETYIGKFEERMPFMFLHFPEWFLESYPKAAKNMEVNQKRLMTLFDVHATLLQLLDMRKTQIPSDTLGLSLLEEIPENRTCSAANIEPHYCPCTEYDYVSPSDSVTVKAAQAIVKDINTQLKPYKKCAVLKVDNITDAKVTKANDIMLKYLTKKKPKPPSNIKVIYQYLVTLKVKPGGGMFEGSVQYDSSRDTYKVLGISRINMYGDQSLCIDIHRLKIFCYCY